MFYVLFTYSKGRKERDYRGFRSEDELIEFLHKDYEIIDIVQIIGVEKTYRLGLIEIGEIAKSPIISQEIETDLPDPEEQESLIPEIKLSSKGKDLSGMEKIADDIEKELTEEQILEKNKAALERADNAIEAAKKDLAKKNTKLIINPAEKPATRPYTKHREVDKSDWRNCPECHKNKMAPWNKSERCSECQQYKKIPKKK